MPRSKGSWYAARWEILKRDKFTCRYCGQKAPDVVLHVDHIEAKVNGGSNHADNLITSCSACNIGKGTASWMEFLKDEGRDDSRVMVRQIEAFLLTNGASTATTIARSLSLQRSNVSATLNKDPRFRKLKREGNRVFYALD